MKNIWYFIVVIVAVVGCSKSSISDQDSLKVASGVISLSSDTGLENEPDVKSGAEGQKLRYVVEAWTVGQMPSCAFHEEYSGTESGLQVSINLVPGQYDLLFWADYGESGVYDVADLTRVRRSKFELTDAIVPDAFAAVRKNFDWDAAVKVDATLVRPVSKVSVLGKENFTESKEVKITYSNLPTEYNVRTGVASVGSANADVTVTYPNTVSGIDKAAEDFLFVPSESASKVGMKISVGGVERTLYEVPLKQNYKVNITAGF